MLFIGNLHVYNLSFLSFRPRLVKITNPFTVLTDGFYSFPLDTDTYSLHLVLFS